MEHCGCQRAYSAELTAFEGVEVPFVIQDSIDPVGEELYPKEKIRILQLRSVAKAAMERRRLIERIDYHGREGKLGITFQEAGMKTLVKEL